MKAATRAFVLAAVLGALAIPATATAVPRDFFGIGPQTPLTAADISRMRAGGIGSVGSRSSGARCSHRRGRPSTGALSTKQSS